MMTVFWEDLTTNTLCRRVTPQLCKIWTHQLEPHAIQEGETAVCMSGPGCKQSAMRPADKMCQHASFVSREM